MADDLATLQSLKPLQKVHYSFPDQMIASGDPKLKEYIRIVRSASISGTYGTEAEVHAKIHLCTQINALPSPVPCSLAIAYSPWHQAFGKDLPPTDVGPTHTAELDLFRSKLTSIKQWLAIGNAETGGSVRVTAILLDSERFDVKPPGDPAAETWNTAIDQKYNAIVDIARTLFPAARIEWFLRGMDEADVPTGWKVYSGFTYREKATSFSCCFYRMWEIGACRELFKRTLAFGIARTTATQPVSVTPWIALGAGFRRQADTFHRWYLDYDYDPVYSLLLGREMNISSYSTDTQRYAPWNKMKVGVFYPGAFDSRTPAWTKHFIAYVKGANGATSL